MRNLGQIELNLWQIWEGTAEPESTCRLENSFYPDIGRDTLAFEIRISLHEEKIPEGWSMTSVRVGQAAAKAWWWSFQGSDRTGHGVYEAFGKIGGSGT